MTDKPKANKDPEDTVTRLVRLIQLLIGVAMIAGAGYAIVVQKRKLSQVGAHTEHGAELFYERLEAAKSLNQSIASDPDVRLPRPRPRASRNNRSRPILT